jgi:hypothetical protein
MVPAILDFARRVKAAFGVAPGRVLEVGSYNVNGTIRDVFEPDALSYLGVDLAAGPGVDLVLDAHDLGFHFPPESFNTVLCCECLEHDLTPWVTVAHLRALLKPGGHLLVTTPTFGFPLHRHPIDCYRFGEDAYRGFVFAGYDVLGLEQVGSEDGSPILCCLGRKPRAPGPAAAAPPAARPADRPDALAHLRADVSELYAWAMNDAIRLTAKRVLPPGAAVLVVSRGDEELVRLLGPGAGHFPAAAGGGYAGGNPADDAGAIAELEAGRGRGADFLLFPRTSVWWLGHYAAFAGYLAARYPKVWDSHSCVIYRLADHPA